MPNPAFGKADLSNCEREQIQLAGAIQPHGALLVVDADTGVVVQCSGNAAEFLQVGGPLLGERLSDLPGDCAIRTQPYLGLDLDTLPAAARCHVGINRTHFDCMVHRPHERTLVYEFEPAQPPIDPTAALQSALQRISDAHSLTALCDEVAAIFKAMVGYHRVMVYRFDDYGNGEIFSERCEGHLEPFLGMHYPASDIPQIARRLYEKNRVRLLSDVLDDQIPITPRLCPMTGAELDMSLCALRSMSPIHVQYLKNMGVSGTLVMSLMVAGRLWGLVSCHHYKPRVVGYEIRVLCELLAEAVGTRIAALESFEHARAELSVRRVEQRMREATLREGDWRSALFDSAEPLLKPLGATGAALVFEGQVMTVGDVPATEQLRSIARWLDGQVCDEVFATDSLAEHDSQFAGLVSLACGLVAAPLSAGPSEYVLWLRPERKQTVVWGGNPNEPFIVGDDPNDLSPRRSFAKWHESVEGTSEPWSEVDITAARLIARSIADVIDQFRSVGVLIARDQFQGLQGQMKRAGQPVFICDADGVALLRNDAFAALLPAGVDVPENVEGLPTLFETPGIVQQGLDDLIGRQLRLRCDVEMEVCSGERRAVLLRGEPVIAAGEKVLGYVVTITDITEQRSAELARQHFQERLIDRNAFARLHLRGDSGANVYQLLGLVVDNAQLAALEITDGLEPSRMPEMLDSVQFSVARSARLLETLMNHVTDGAEDS